MTEYIKSSLTFSWEFEQRAWSSKLMILPLWSTTFSKTNFFAVFHCKQSGVGWKYCKNDYLLNIFLTLLHLFWENYRPSFPMMSMTESSLSTNLMDLEKYEHNFHFPFIFLFDQSPLYNRTWTLREATACWRFLLTFSLQDMQTQCKYNNYLVN